MTRSVSILAFFRERLIALLPAMAVVAALTWVALRGPTHPVSLLLAAALFASALFIVLLRMPATLFALFPLAMVWNLDAPVEPFDLALCFLACIAALPYVSRWRPSVIRLNPIERSYCIFLACLLTTLATPFDARRLIGVTKAYAFGMLAYEVARRGARRYGRHPLLWGLMILSAITVVQLIFLFATSGISTAQLAHHRTLLTEVSWGSSNYVAAVLVVLLPAALWLQRTPDGSHASRRLGTAAFVGTLTGVLLSTSRGGVLLGLAATLNMFRGAWRARGRLIAAAVAVLALVALTPAGSLVMHRFQDPQGVYSVGARWEVWKATWERGVSHLPFGVGHGQGRIQGDELGGIDPHNFLLTLFSEGGPLAVATWLMLLYAVWQRGQLLARTPGGETAGRSLRLLVALATLNSLFEPTFSGSLYYTLFWWSVGALDAGQVATVQEVAIEDDPTGEELPGGQGVTSRTHA